jgi:hypothetical protein
VTDDIQPTQETAEDNLYHSLTNALEYLDGDELAAAADALVVKTWASIRQDGERGDAAAVAMGNLIDALDLYIKIVGRPHI